jgi:hypothetical protein
MEDKSFRYLGFWGGKSQTANFGALSIAVCGLPLIMTVIAQTAISPVWLFWFFIGGVILGVVLILGGLFAVDVKRN